MELLEIIFAADRVLPQVVKLCLLLGALSLIVEGILELKNLEPLSLVRPPCQASQKFSSTFACNISSGQLSP
jgi:hypothetical protein